MKRQLAFLAVIAAATPCLGHFVYIVPSADIGEFQVVFSEAPAPDENVVIDKILATQLVAIDADGKRSSVAWTKSSHALRGALPARTPLLLGGVTEYGWVQSKHTGNVPILLKYYPKAIVGDPRACAELRLGKDAPFEIIPLIENDTLKFVALRDGKPVADAACAVLVPGAEKKPLTKTDSQGRIPGSFDRPGRYAVKVKVIDEVSGEWKGQKYDKAHHWATLVVDYTTGVQ